MEIYVTFGKSDELISIDTESGAVDLAGALSGVRMSSYDVLLARELAIGLSALRFGLKMKKEKKK